MFYKVLTSFFYFLIWYGLFLVAFGFSFYIMLHKDIEGRVKSSEEDEYKFFNTTFLSVIKTLSMFVGELEFSDIPIDLESSLYPVNYLFFISFVFLIVVVLMNLLNGLAVSDTGVIQEQAEIFSHISRVETISYLESVLLGDPFDFLSNVPSLLSWLPSCSLFRQLYRSHRLRGLLVRLSADNILLFYNFLQEKRSPKLFPNRRRDECNYCSHEMDPETIRAAKKIVSRKTEVPEAGHEDDIKDRFMDLEQRMVKMQAQLDAKMDLILSRIH